MINNRNLLKSKLTQNVFWLVGAKVYHMVINLVVSMMMARFLGPSNYGLINYAASLTAMFTALCTLGINSILVNELLRCREEGVILGTSILLRLISSCLSIITIVALAYGLNPGEPVTVQVVLIYSTTLIFQCFDTLHYWYQANQNSKVSAIITAVGYTAASLYKVFLLLSGRDVRWFAASHVVEYLLVAVLLTVSYYRWAAAGQKLRVDRCVAQQLLSRSYHFILSGMMVAIYGQMDRIMLKSMLGDSAVGYYSAAVSVCNLWPFVLTAVIDAAKPIVLAQFDASRERFERYLTVLYGVILYISFAAAVAITLLSRPIILILYGEAYLQARPALCILCWNTAFSYLGVARSIWLVPQGKQKYEKYLAATGALCNLVLNYLLIPRWGVEGAAFATLVTQIATNFLVGFLFRDIRRNNQLLLRALWPFRYLKQTGKNGE